MIEFLEALERWREATKEYEEAPDTSPSDQVQAGIEQGFALQDMLAAWDAAIEDGVRSALTKIGYPAP